MVQHLFSQLFPGGPHTCPGDVCSWISTHAAVRVLRSVSSLNVYSCIRCFHELVGRIVCLRLQNLVVPFVAFCDPFLIVIVLID